jgi:chromosome partitioning protein
MTKVISFISRKGGTGKTTNAINLCTMLHSLGHAVALIETDTNYTLNTLRQMELFKTGANDKQLFPILPSEDDLVPKELKKLSKSKLDYVIVDSAGKTTDAGIKEICLVSDLIIVPTSLTQNDLLVTFQTIQDLKPAQDLNKKLVISILPSRINSLTKSKTVNAALSELDATVINSFVPARNSFAQSSTILPEKDYLNVTKEVLSILNA